MKTTKSLSQYITESFEEKTETNEGHIGGSDFGTGFSDDNAAIKAIVNVVKGSKQFAKKVIDALVKEKIADEKTLTEAILENCEDDESTVTEGQLTKGADFGTGFSDDNEAIKAIIKFVKGSKDVAKKLVQHIKAL